MPVRYSDESSGPGTRAAEEEAYPFLLSYEDLTKAELQMLLKARDLPTTGSKAELIERLEE